MLHNTHSDRKLSDQEKAKFFSKIIQETFSYLNTNKNEFTIFLKHKKDYLEIQRANLDFEKSQYTFSNGVKGKEWLTHISGIRLSYQSYYYLNHCNAWESQQHLTLGNQDFFQNKQPLSMQNAVIEFIKLLPWKAQKKIFKAYYNFKHKQTPVSLRRLWRMLTYVVHIQFRLSYHWLDNNWAELDIYTNEEFKYYKNELIKANQNNTEPSNIRSLSLLKLCIPNQHNDNVMHNSVENFFDLNQQSPIKFKIEQKNTKKTYKVVRRVINAIQNN